MTKIPVRIIRTFDVLVGAEYGDDDDRLIAKAKGILDDGDPTNDPPVAAEIAVVMDSRFDSPHDTYDEHVADNIPAEAAEPVEDQ